jgi:hypothetical protein
MNTASVCEKKVALDSCPESYQSKKQITIDDCCGESCIFFVTIGEQLDAAAVAAVTGHAKHTFYLVNQRTGQVYHPFLQESYVATATETDPVLTMIVLDSSVAKAIEAILLHTRYLSGMMSHQLNLIIGNLQNDFHVAMTVVTKLDAMSLGLFSEEVRNNRDVVMAAVIRNGWALKHASPAMQNNPDVVRAAVTNDGDALKHASPAMQENRRVVLVAVSQNGFALQWAGRDMQKDLDVVVAAVAQNGFVLDNVIPSLQVNLRVVVAAVGQNGEVLDFVTPSLQDNPEVVLTAVTRDGWALQYASYRLQKKRPVVRAAVRQKGTALQFASPRMRANRKIVRAAVRQDGWALQYASHRLQKNREMVMAVRNTPLSPEPTILFSLHHRMATALLHGRRHV